MQTEPSFVENLLRSQFNTGQDGLMQMIRSAGEPFDTSELFKALAPIRNRQLQGGLAELRAGAPGIGQRFGSAMRRNEGLTVMEHLQNIAAQDAATQFQAHESAANRQLQAGGQQLNLLTLLANAENARRGMNANLLTASAGVPRPAPTSFGQPLVDMGQLLLLNQLGAGNANTPMNVPFIAAPRPTLNVDPRLFN